jgi:hypothetical protein
MIRFWKPKLATVLTFRRLDAAWVEVGPIYITGEGWICQNRTIRFGKLDSPIFPETSSCIPDRSSSNHAGEPRRSSLGTLSEVLLCSCFDWKVHQHILTAPLGNRSSPAMAHYGMRIYNNNAIISFFYSNSEVQYVNYLSTLQVYNINVVDRPRVAMPVLSRVFWLVQTRYVVTYLMISKRPILLLRRVYLQYRTSQVDV